MRTGIARIGALLPLAFLATAHAAAPPLLPLQGVLTDADGVPLTTAVPVRFSLHTAASAGSEVWYETQTVTPVDGLFAAYLGEGTGSPLTLAPFRDQGELWLEVKVGADPPMARVRLGSVAWAGYAEYCGTVPTHTHPAGDLPAGVVVGAQACGGTDKVRGVAATGAIVCGPDLGTGPDTLGQLACNAEQTIKWSGTAWACAGDNDSGGTITVVNAGDGLVSSTSGTATTLSIQSCGDEQVLRYQSAQWQCSPAVQAITAPATGGLAFTTTGATYNLTLTAGCANGQVLKYDSGAAAWGCANDANAGGDVTAVNTAALGGLQGGAASGAVDLALRTCAVGQILKYNATTGWDCAGDADTGGDITAVNTPTAGGLQGGGATGAVNLALKGCLATGQVLKYTLATATWDCAADADAGGDITAVNTPAAGGLQGGAAAGAVTLSLAPCGNNQSLREVGGAWTCVDEITAVNTATAGGLQGGGGSGALGLGLRTCGAGQILKYDTTTGWGCATDANAGGDITAVDTPAAGGLEGGAAAGGVSLSLRPCNPGQLLVYNTTTGWDCAAEGHVGDVVAVAATTGGGVVVGGTAANPTVGLAASGCIEGAAMTFGGGAWGCAPLADAVIGNEVAGAADTTLSLIGAGTALDPYLLSLNLGRANTWTGLQQFTDDARVIQAGDPANYLELHAAAGVGDLRVNGVRALRLEHRATSPSLIGGFSGNDVSDGALGAAIAGGGTTAQGNFVADNFGAVGGGLNNRAGDNDGAPTSAVAATVAGGVSNVAGARAAAVGGGDGNLAGGVYATVPGGALNSATGVASFAAGTRASAARDGCFVWADYDNARDVTCGRDNQFLAQARGGARFNVNGAAWVEVYDDTASLIGTSTGAHLTSGGVWQNSSDRDRKTDFAPVDPRAVLGRVASLPITTWRYRVEGADVRHLGPTAQDFHAAFGLGTDERSIGTVDTDGVALAAIQGLHQSDGDLRVENAQLRARVSGLEARVAQLTSLEARVAQLERARPAGAEARGVGLGAFGLLVAGGLVVARRRRGN